MCVNKAARALFFKTDNMKHLAEYAGVLQRTFVDSVLTMRHRFGSFAPIRENVAVKLYVDAEGLLHLVINKAQHTIYIKDWWLSPKIPLHRPHSQLAASRFDQLLKAP